MFSPNSVGVFNTVDVKGDRNKQLFSMPVKGLKLNGSLRSTKTPSKQDGGGQVNISTDIDDL
jgi:hypothetical protein